MPDDETTYKIIRFYGGSAPNVVIETGLTLEEAQQHCQREDTHGLDESGTVVWFDGYDKETT